MMINPHFFTQSSLTYYLPRVFGFSKLNSNFCRNVSTFVKKGIELRGRPIYLDFQATTPLDPRVLDKMLPWMTENFGNPHSRTHFYGWEADEGVEEARKNIADLIKTDPKSIIFTSGATEANNAAIKGVAHFYKLKKKNHIITTQIEHKCVLESCRQLATEGFRVTFLPVQPNGILDPDTLRAAITPETVLVSCMYVNNEVGVKQQIAEIGKICRENKVFFHTDAAQGFGKVPIDVDAMNIDIMSISAHKIYGPKGIGALYVRRKPRIRIDPIISGGGQERGLRSGTLSPFLVVGFGEAARIASFEMDNDLKHCRRLYHKLIDELSKKLDFIQINGDLREEFRYPGNLNISFSFVEGESLLMGLKEIAVSSGSACTSATLEPSYVLRALGVSEDLAHTSLRFGIGRFTTEAEVDLAIDQTVTHVKRLRSISPLYEMAQEGIDISKVQWGKQ